MIELKNFPKVILAIIILIILNLKSYFSDTTNNTCEYGCLHYNAIYIWRVFIVIYVYENLPQIKVTSNHVGPAI